jgi:hypothetical protein
VRRYLLGRRTGTTVRFTVVGATSSNPYAPLPFLREIFLFPPLSVPEAVLAMGHLNRSIDGVFEIVRVVGRSFVSIAEVHAIFARAQQAQREPEVARNRFRFLERHGLVK